MHDIFAVSWRAGIPIDLGSDGKTHCDSAGARVNRMKPRTINRNSGLHHEHSEEQRPNVWF